MGKEGKKIKAFPLLLLSRCCSSELHALSQRRASALTFTGERGNNGEGVAGLCLVSEMIVAAKAHTHMHTHEPGECEWVWLAR